MKTGNGADLHIRIFAYWSDDRYRSPQGQIWTPLTNAGEIQREGFKKIIQNIDAVKFFNKSSHKKKTKTKSIGSSFWQHLI